MSKGFHINDETFNVNYSLLTENGKFNKMANLLADENDVSIKVATFNGSDKTEFVKRNEYGFQCLLIAMEKAMNYCDAINDTFVKVGELQRKEKKMFHFDAFKEAWINACVHNDWKQGTSPAIYVFQDRMEIVSIGGIPSGMTKEQFLRGESRPVNEELMRIFMACGIVEQSGHGVPLIVKEYGEKAYTFEGDFIKVTIPFDTTGFARTKEVTGEVTGEVKLSEKEKIVYDLILVDPYIKRKDLMSKSGYSKNTIDNIIKQLKIKSIIKGRTSDKGGKWLT